MMPTLEVIKFRDVIRIQDIPRFVPNQVSPTLEVVGEDFTSVEQVLLNESTIVSYTILNKNTMWILVPASAKGELRNLEIISGNFTKTNASSKVTFSIGTRPKKLDGILKLTQLYTKWLLQSPGSDIFNPQHGGGLQDLVGRLVDINRMDHILSAMTRSVETTSSQIRTAQANVVGLSLSERLLQATLVDVDRSYDRLEARARVHLVSMAGDDALSNLIL
jgi:hypothetical protein